MRARCWSLFAKIYVAVIYSTAIDEFARPIKESRLRCGKGFCSRYEGVLRVA